MKRHFALGLLRSALTAVLLLSVQASAKDSPAKSLSWPESGPPILRFTFGKFKEVSSLAGVHTYATDTTAENLWSKPISDATFSLYMYDKNHTRIGEGYVSVSNVEAGQTIKFQTTIDASGTPATIELAARYLQPDLARMVPARKVSVWVNSAPQGAVLRVDGAEVGKTPKSVELTVGKHQLDFAKEGFDPGTFPVDIGPGELGPTYTYEFGNLDHDTVELRDGTVLTGDLLSVGETDVVIRVGGASRRLDRAQVKRISLAQSGHQ